MFGWVVPGVDDDERYNEDIHASNTLTAPDCISIAPGSPSEIRDGFVCTRILRHSVNLIEIG